MTEKYGFINWAISFVLHFENHYIVKHPLIISLFYLLSIAAKAQIIPDAVNKSDSAMLISLLRAGSSVNQIDTNKNTGLVIACRWADEKMVRVLINNGATIDYPRTPDGRTPLMVTCIYNGDVNIFKLLLDKGADINATSKDDVTALMLAAMNEKIDVVNFLLAKGADPNMKDANGLTALDYATKSEVNEFMQQQVPTMRFDKYSTMDALKKVTKR
jgi:ankyrin repeat protein